MSDQMMSDPIRILIADAHPLLRAGLQATLTQEADFIVVGEAETGPETQQLCQALQPDVVLLALNLPGPAATETVATLRTKHPGAKLIILTNQQDEATIRRMMNTGIDGYILKDEAPQTVVQAIRRVLLGGKWFSDAIVATLTQDQHHKQMIALTSSELDILSWIADGSTDQTIATRLHISKRTLRYQLSKIYDKLGASNRAEAVAIAYRLGLLG